MHYICSYRPLVRTKQGRTAIEEYSQKPFRDGSCRCEPDFENPFPSITALCRFTKFAPRLLVDDEIVYITKKGSYLEVDIEHWRIPAILKVKYRAESHQEASIWYDANNKQLPRNCMVKGSPPVPFSLTDGVIPEEIKSRRERLTDEQIVRLWDAGYQDRANKCGVFLVCEAQHINLSDPPIILEEEMLQIFGKIPSTQNPPKISSSQYEKLLNIVSAWKKE